MLLQHVQNVSVTLQSTIQRLCCLVRHQTAKHKLLHLPLCEACLPPLACLNGPESWPGMCRVLLDTKGGISVVSSSPPWLWAHSDSVFCILSISGKLWFSGTRFSNCVVRNSGLLACSAYNGHGQCHVPADLGPVPAVAADARYLCSADRWSAGLLWTQRLQSV